jgi:hypothetical protein
MAVPFGHRYSTSGFADLRRIMSETLARDRAAWKQCVTGHALTNTGPSPKTGGGVTALFSPELL